VLTRIGLLMLATLAFHSAWAGSPPADPVARVNGTAITRADLDRSLAFVAARNHATLAALQHSGEFPRIEHVVLNSLVEQEILWQAARVKHTPDPAAVDRELDQVRSRYGSKQAFTEAMARAGQTEASVKEQIRRQSAIAAYMSAEVTKKIHITDADIERYYHDHPEMSHRLRLYRLREILIPAKAKHANAEAHKLQAEARGGADFAALARKHSADGNAALGGDLGYVAVNLFPEPFQKAVRATAPGKVSDVVETRFGLQIVEVEARRGGEPVALSRVHDRIRTQAFQTANRAGVKARIKALTKKAKVDILLKDAPSPSAQR